MIVIADTTPLNYLIQLGLPEVLHELYGRILVPSAVLQEMRDVGAPARVRAWADSPPQWLEETPVQHLDASLSAHPGLGEREAISLALEQRADVLLIDESAGRRDAKERHLFVAGTLAVLLQASLRGYCDFPEAIEQLRRYGFWLSSSTERLMMSQYEDAKREQC